MNPQAILQKPIANANGTFVCAFVWFGLFLVIFSFRFSLACVFFSFSKSKRFIQKMRRFWLRCTLIRQQKPVAAVSFQSFDLNTYYFLCNARMSARLIGTFIYLCRGFSSCQRQRFEEHTSPFHNNQASADLMV